MGLDMYLNRHIYIGANYEHNKITGTVNLERNGVPIEIDTAKIVSIITTVAYWRKANCIHKWFVENLQGGEDDCKEYYVDREQLKELCELCKKILANRELAEIELPTASGFFFGSEEYDEYYYENLEHTVQKIEAALTDEEGDFYYRSSW